MSNSSSSSSVARMTTNANANANANANQYSWSIGITAYMKACRLMHNTFAAQFPEIGQNADGFVDICCQYHYILCNRSINDRSVVTRFGQLPRDHRHAFSLALIVSGIRDRVFVELACARPSSDRETDRSQSHPIYAILKPTATPVSVPGLTFLRFNTIRQHLFRLGYRTCATTFDSILKQIMGIIPFQTEIGAPVPSTYQQLNCTQKVTVYCSPVWRERYFRPLQQAQTRRQQQVQQASRQKTQAPVQQTQSQPSVDEQKVIVIHDSDDDDSDDDDDVGSLKLQNMQQALKTKLRSETEATTNTKAKKRKLSENKVDNIAATTAPSSSTSSTSTASSTAPSSSTSSTSTTSSSSTATASSDRLSVCLSISARNKLAKDTLVQKYMDGTTPFRKPLDDVEVQKAAGFLYRFTNASANQIRRQLKIRTADVYESVFQTADREAPAFLAQIGGTNVHEENCISNIAYGIARIRMMRTKGESNAKTGGNSGGNSGNKVKVYNKQYSEKYIWKRNPDRFTMKTIEEICPKLAKSHPYQVNKTKVSFVLPAPISSSSSSSSDISASSSSSSSSSSSDTSASPVTISRSGIANL